MSSEELVSHLGSCHCGAVKYEIQAPAVVTVPECNCSICKKKQIKAFLVPKDRFELLQGEDALTTYSYNTGVAKHTFCKICGVQPFYSSRSRPDCYGIILHCLDTETIKEVKKYFFDGKNWDQGMKEMAVNDKKA